VVQFTKKVVAVDMNSCLTKEFSKDEVEIALKQMAPLKSPGSEWNATNFFPTLLGRG